MAYPVYPQKSQSVQGQTLDLTSVGCYNLSDKEWFSRQDPYLVIDYSGQQFRTRTDTDGGRNPSFNETFKLSMIEGLREINASVWNSNTIERDDYIGSTKILLNKVIENGYDDSQWQLTNNVTGKSAGVLKLIMHSAGGAGKAKPGKQEANPLAVAASPAGNPAPAYGVPSHSHHYPPQQVAAAPYPQPVPYGAPPRQLRKRLQSPFTKLRHNLLTLCNPWLTLPPPSLHTTAPLLTPRPLPLGGSNLKSGLRASHLTGSPLIGELLLFPGTCKV